MKDDAWSERNNVLLVLGELFVCASDSSVDKLLVIKKGNTLISGGKQEYNPVHKCTEPQGHNNWFNAKLHQRRAAGHFVIECQRRTERSLPELHFQSNFSFSHLPTKIYLTVGQISVGVSRFNILRVGKSNQLYFSSSAFFYFQGKCKMNSNCNIRNHRPEGSPVYIIDLNMDIWSVFLCTSGTWHDIDARTSAGCREI